MTIRILSVGKLKERYFTEACAEYAKRLTRYAMIETVEVQDEKTPEKLSDAERARAMDREGARLLEKLRPDDYVIALAIGGRAYGSEAFSEHVFSLFAQGKSRLCFVIGGSLGLAEGVLARADERLSLGPMTLPHRIARLVLLEQLYRACKIHSGETYHK